jgi:hypothetical protein
MTMAVGCLICALLVCSFRQISALTIILLPFLAVADLTYYTSRINFLDLDNYNLSALVYIQGWQMVIESWRQTFGVGLGFQQMGFGNSDVGVSHLIQEIAGESLNLNDGGFTFAKIVSEFGVLGCLAIFFYVFLAVESLLLVRLSASSETNLPPIFLLSASFLIGYGVELFVRGAGYFTPTGLIGLAALIIYLHERRRTGPKKLAMPEQNEKISRKEQDCG